MATVTDARFCARRALTAATPPIMVRSMERLRGLDTSFLYMETPTTHLHVAWAAVLDTRGPPRCRVGSGLRPPGSPRTALCELIGGRLHRLLALRRRLADRRLGTRSLIGSIVDVDPVDHFPC